MRRSSIKQLAAEYSNFLNSYSRGGLSEFSDRDRIAMVAMTAAEKDMPKWKRIKKKLPRKEKAQLREIRI